MNITTHVNRVKKIKNAWRYTSTPLYAFVANTDTILFISCISLFNYGCRMQMVNNSFA